MPYPLLYSGTQDDDRTRSIDVVHIEPSIREGVHLIPSLYGSDASYPIYRYPPTNTVAPWISGDTQIPATLTCNEGQWPASPKALFAYQWMKDGTDIPGATSRYYDTVTEDDATNITCEVRGYNSEGQAYAITPPAYVTLIEPIEIWEQEDYVVTGVEVRAAQTTRDERTMVMTGFGARDALTAARGIAYFSTGMAAVDRHDMNAMDLPVITGMADLDNMHMLDDSGVGVVNWDTGKPFSEEVIQPLHIKNGTAEMGVAGWEIFGAATIYGIPYDRYEGDYCWWGGANVDAAQANIPYSYMWQDVEIWPIWESEVDLGNTSILISWYQSNAAWEDQANVKVEFYNAVGGFISGNDGPGLLATRQDVWTYRKLQTNVPAGTRAIRVIMEFNLQEGVNNNAYIDFINGQIHTGTYPSGRDFGPDFEEWRIRFTQANTYSGTALSELEFRNGVGGADLATGGTILKGSEGIGGLATYAFDDLRNTGYWAGAENGVAEDTAWIGYGFGATTRPVEIDITARTGSNSLQVGREFFVEGKDSADDLWTPVQHYDYAQVGDFTSGQQKQFVIADGAKPYTHEQAQIDSGSTGRIFYTRSWQHLGSIFTAKTRMDITHLRAYFEEAATYRLGICKITFQHSWGILYEYTPLDFEVEVVAGGVGYTEGALPTTFSVDVGDSFVVYASDPTDPGSGCRIPYFSVPALENTYYAYRVRSWGSDLELIEGRGNNNGTGPFYDVDFRGTIF